MKRYLAGFSLLLVLAAGMLVWTSLSVNSRRDQVEVREEVLYGDREAAEGLTVGFRMDNYLARLAWHTVFTIGDGEPEPETDFTYKPEIPVERWNNWFLERSSTLLLETWGYGTSSYSTSFARLNTDLNLNWREAPVRAVAARTGAGERRTEVVPLTDYYDSLPWRLEDRETGQVSAAMERKLERLFRVPVEPDWYLAVTVGKDSEGQVVECSMNPADAPREPEVTPMTGGSAAGTTDEAAWPESQWDHLSESLCLTDTEAGIWICPSVRNEAGEELVEYRDGPGVYLLPRISSEKFQASNGSVDPLSLDLDEARLVYATDARPLYLREAADGSGLLLLAEEDGRITLTVIDPERGTARQKLDLLPMDGLWVRFLDQDGLLLVILQSGALALVTEEAGVCGKVLTGRLDPGQTFEAYSMGNVSFADYLRNLDPQRLDLAWDGERLAIAAYYDQVVLVMDRTGLLFMAQYAYSPLWDGRGYSGSDINYLRPMTVSFK